MAYNLSIPGQVSEHQLKAIETVAGLVPKDGKVVEVGSLFGCSSWAWAKSVDPSVTVYCIDPWEKNEGVGAMEARYGIVYGLDQFKRHTADCPNIRALQGYSPPSFEDWTDPIDLYYEDAVHVDPILAQNLAFWTGKLKPGGIICGDDYRPRFPDVRRGARELAERCGRELIRVDFFWCLLPDERTLPGSAAVVERLRELGRDSDAFKRTRGLSFSIGPRKPIPPIEAGDNIVVPCRVANDGLDAWPTETAGSLGIGVRIVAAEAPGRMLAESRVPMPLTQIEPDVPSDIDLVLPTATLPPGSYRAVFDLLGPEGRWVTHPKLAAAKGNPFDVGEGSTVFGASTRRKTAHKYSGHARLLDEEVAARDFVRLVFADSHGAFEGHLGAGLLYYSLGLLVRSQVSVCVGSGGGFVPSLMRRAQLDAGIDPSVTYLVDANLPELAFGSPIQSGGWMTDGNAFLKRESDIVILPVLSVDAAKLFASEGLRIDYLHVDGDHSKPGFLADVRAFAPLLADTGIVTFHDVRLPGVAEALSELRRLNAELEILTFPEIGAGTGVLRRRVPVTLPRRAQTGSGFVDASRKTTLAPQSVAPAVAGSQERSRFERWSYLKTPAYQTRYNLAAAFVDQSDRAVVEIGGFPNSIVFWLEKSRTAHLVEPYAPDSFVKDVEKAAKQRAVEAFVHRHPAASAALQPLTLRPYNLVALGLDLSAGARGDEGWSENFSAFLRLISNAERAVVEVPGSRASQITWDHLAKILKPRIVGDITLDLTRDPVADSFHVKDNRAVRRLLMLEIDHVVDPNAADVQTLIRLAAREVDAANTAAFQPANSRYTFGTPILFRLDGNSQGYTREGWVQPEARHRWMSGESSRLIVAVSEPAEAVIASSTVRICMQAKPFVVPGKLKHQTLSIIVNSETIFESTIETETRIEASMPATLFFTEQPAEIIFRHLDAARPCDLIAGSSDRKVLAFAVTEVSLMLQV